MSEPITLTFTHQEKEYVAATRWFYARVYHTRFLLILYGIVLSLGLLLILFSEELVFGGMIASVGFIAFVVQFRTYFEMPSQFFRRNPRFREQFSLQFSEEGLLFQTKDMESKLEWAFYSKVLETSQFYMLCYDQDMFTLIPKRVFDDNEREQAFRDLLNRKLRANLDIRGGN
jgi:hypothetical protein